MKDRPGSVLEMIGKLKNDPGDAIVCGEERISYRELVTAYRSFARELSRSGVKKGDAVFLCKKRGIDYLISMLGILAAGGVCVQADPDWPEKRKQSIINDCGAKHKVTDDGICTLNESGNVNESAFREEAPEALPTMMPGDACMIIYSSGSTGAPKGSMITHGMLCDPVIQCKENVLATDAGRCRNVYMVLSFSHAFTMHDTFIALGSGKRLILATDEERSDPGLIGALIDRWSVDMMSMTPSLLQNYLMNPIFAAAVERLKLISLAGELLSEKLEKQICGIMKGTVYDGYGSTEMLHCGDRKCRVDGEASSLIPTLGVTFHVFRDLEDFQEAAPGEEGELLIGGIRAQYARYLKREELNSVKFLQHPVYGRLFRTGDRALLSHNGQIAIRGRLDGVLKLRGQRLEPQEIELYMAQFPGITGGAVKIQGEGDQAQLVAFYASKEEINLFELREWLSARLPHYMIPVRFARLEHLPVNGSGKLDRKALPYLPEDDRTASYKKASNEAQSLLCSLFQAVLKTKRPVGVLDNFFELGGDSIKGMQIASLVRREGYELSLKDLFSYPTVEKLSGVMKKATDTERGSEKSREQGIASRLNQQEKKMITALADWDNVEAVYPFLPAMKNRLYSGGDRVWFNADLMYIKRPVDEKRLKKRYLELVMKRQMLRAFVICPESGQPMTVVLKNSGTSLFTMDLRWMKGDEGRQKRHIQSFIRAVRSEGFPAGQPTFRAGLIRLEEDKQMLLILYSHYLLDGMSIQRIAGELLGETELFSDSSTVSRYYRRWEAAALAQDTASYWKKLLGDQKEFTQLAAQPGKRTERNVRTRRFRLPMEPVREYCGKHHVTPAAWIHALLGMSLSELTGSEKVAFVSMGSGRTEALTEDEALTGNYATEVPFLYRRGEVPADCQKQLLESNQRCMYDFSSAGDGREGIQMREGFVRCDILNYPLSEATVPDNFFLTDDNYTQTPENYLKELQMFLVLADHIYFTCIYSEAHVSDEAVRTLETLLKKNAARMP